MPLFICCNHTQSNGGRPTGLPSRGDQPTPKNYKPQTSVKKDFSAFITIARGLAGVMKEVKKGVQYFTGMFKDIMDRRAIETVGSEEQWKYERTEKPVTVEEVTEPKIKATTGVLLGATPVNRRMKTRENRLGKKKRRRKKGL